MRGTIEMGLKTRAFFRNLAHRAQTKNLIAAAVGEDRPVPTHEPVQPAKLTNQFMAGTQIEMIGVAEQDLTTEFVQITRQHRLDGSLRPHRHKARRFDRAMRGHQPAKTSLAVRVLLENCEMSSS